MPWPEWLTRFLTRTFSECTIESQVSAINDIGTSSRQLKQEQSERLTFISSNGSHPLVSLKVVEDALNLHFKGKKWQFVLSNTTYYTSKTVDRLKIWPTTFNEIQFIGYSIFLLFDT